ncbi:MAG: hypothetical protein ACE5FN_12515, partial [Leptospirillia bacterium]
RRGRNLSTFHLKRIARPEVLKSIGRPYLLELLQPHTKYLFDRGVTLPAPDAVDDIPYDKLARALISPIVETPRSLIDALYFVDQMATPSKMDALLGAAELAGIDLNGHPDPAPADVAVQAWLKAPDLIERYHAEQCITNRRSFEYFQTDRSDLPLFESPNQETLTALEGDLNEWFERKGRGRGARVFVYDRLEAVWFLVRHGEPLKREGSIEAEKSSSVFYRPEKYDVLAYDPALGELRVNASSKGEKELYRTMFGLHLFGSEHFFPGKGKYVLSVLQTDGKAALACMDVEGMDSVTLREVHFYWEGRQNGVSSLKAKDVFAAYEENSLSFPNQRRIVQASFQVKFTDAKTPRMVTVCPSNVARYTRDGDSTVVEEWLSRRGFIVS